MEVQRATAEDVFRKYTRLPKDKDCYIIDVRPYKEWKRHHLLLSYCVRLSSNGVALVDCSKNRYDQKWAQVQLHTINIFLGVAA
jgi:rhodanese-related sulfurtransferase